ncbi:MAG: alpha/beta fold hydrolase [Chloroflexota bacterium]
MQSFVHGGLVLAYDRRGSGAPLVLIHGYPLDHSTWDETASLLARDFDLILPDVRGLGESAASDAAYAMDDLAADLAALLDHLKIKKAFVAGHSMGGYITLAFARAYPERLLGLALVSSQAVADTPERKEGRYAAAKQVAETGIASVVDAMTPKLSADARVQAYVRALMGRQKPAGVIGSLKAMAERETLTSALSNLECPILLIHGDADVLIPVERAREVKALVPSADLFELAGLGHMPMMENPAAVADALKRFPG